VCVCPPGTAPQGTQCVATTCPGSTTCVGGVYNTTACECQCPDDNKVLNSGQDGCDCAPGVECTNGTLNSLTCGCECGANLELNDDVLGRGGRRQVRFDESVKPSDNLLVSFNPRFELSRSGDQYVTATSTLPYAETYGTRYLFADLDRRTFSMQTRVDWTFSPTLSLQLFAQPLLSSGDYLQYKQLAESQSFDFSGFVPGTATTTGTGIDCSGTICDVDGTQHVDFDGDGTTDYAFGDRDFNIRSLIGNAVLRWEYRPGSTLFLVWTHGRSAYDQRNFNEPGRFSNDLDASTLFDNEPENTFLVKVSYWLPM